MLDARRPDVPFLADVEQRDDARVPQARDDPRLLLEEADPGLVCAEFGEDALDGYVLDKPRRSARNVSAIPRRPRRDRSRNGPNIGALRGAPSIPLRRVSITPSIPAVGGPITDGERPELQLWRAGRPESVKRPQIQRPERNVPAAHRARLALAPPASGFQRPARAPNR